MIGLAALSGLAGGIGGGLQDAQAQEMRRRLQEMQLQREALTLQKGRYDLGAQQGADQILANSPDAVGMALSGLGPQGMPQGIGALAGQGTPPMGGPQAGSPIPPQPQPPMGGPPLGGQMASASPPPGGGPTAPFAARFSPSPGPMGGPPMMPGIQQRFPGATLSSAPQNQPQPAPPPQRMPFAPEQVRVGGQPQPQGQMPGMPEQADWKGIWQRLMQNNPGAPPGALIGAMDKLIQMRSPIERAQWAEQRAMFSQMMQMANYNFKTGKFDYEENKQQDEAKNIVDGIEQGITPPMLTGLYRMRPLVEAEAQKRGVNLSKLQLQWYGAMRQMASLRGPQATRFMQTAVATQGTLGRLRELAQQQGMGRLVDLNAAQLEAEARTGNQLAVRYIEDVTALRDEMAALVQGGYTPTESAWKQANTLVNGNYGVGALNAQLGELERIINYRIRAFQDLGGQIGGMGSPNPYLGETPNPILGRGQQGEGGGGGWSGQPSE